ncbi:MAG TPA: hypothetical protein VF132_04900 [Rudaea sp.]
MNTSYDTNSYDRWNHWRDVKPATGERVSVRSTDYIGEAHQYEDRMRAWNPDTGYGADLLLDEDPEAQWTSVLEDGLPARFSVD